MKTKEEFLVVLNKLRVSDAAWDDGERILTVNGEPVGCTVQNPDAIRWWPSLKEVIAEHLAKESA